MPIITPPFRTSLLTQNGVPFGTDNGDVQTAKDWWLYWNQLTDRSNTNSKLAGEGAHADRPDPGSMPDGAIYIEADRGVIYSNEGGTWQYIAGTMYGTLSPDQRPTDLGVNDGGFDFRGTDQPREFLWSQTAWVEVTAVQYGTHANRPNPTTIVEGALYVESDRGGVIYQRETPAGTPLWQYLAGTMFGTLSPDQRPAGLGTHDAGFDFRATDQQREYIWSQTAWVEVASQTGDIQIAYGSSSVALTTTAQDLPGLSLTLNRAGRYYLNGVFDLRGSGAGDLGALLIGQLVADGAVQPKLGFMALGSAGNQGSVAQQWVYTASVPGKVCKLQAYKNTGTGGSFAAGEATLTAIWVSN